MPRYFYNLLFKNCFNQNSYFEFIRFSMILLSFSLSSIVVEMLSPFLLPLQQPLTAHNLGAPSCDIPLYLLSLNIRYKKLRPPNEPPILYTYHSCFGNTKILESNTARCCHIIFNVLFVHLQVFGVTCNAQMVLILHFIPLESWVRLIKNLLCKFFLFYT